MSNMPANRARKQVDALLAATAHQANARGGRQTIPYGYTKGDIYDLPGGMISRGSLAANLERRHPFAPDTEFADNQPLH